jgi:hypothetical protein
VINSCSATETLAIDRKTNPLLRKEGIRARALIRNAPKKLLEEFDKKRRAIQEQRTIHA